MSATQTLCDVLSFLSSDTGCPYSDEACRACPLPPAMEPSDGSCQEAFARLLRAARSAPGEGAARDYGRRGEYCSPGESGLPDGAAACPLLAGQGLGNVLTLPLLFAATHFTAVFAGQSLAGTKRPQNTNYLSGGMFFVLCVVKLLDL